MRRHTIEEKVEAALSSLDNIQRAGANEFLFTKIQQRMRNQQQLSTYGNGMFRWAIVLLIFIAANVFMYEKISSPGASKSKPSIENFALEYGFKTGENT